MFVFYIKYAYKKKNETPRFKYQKISVITGRSLRPGTPRRNGQTNIGPLIKEKFLITCLTGIVLYLLIYYEFFCPISVPNRNENCKFKKQYMTERQHYR